MIGRVEPIEKVALNNERLNELYSRLGPAAAENVVSHAMEDLAVALAKCVRSYDKGDLGDALKLAQGIAVLADQVGMSNLAAVAVDVAGLTQRNDGAALAATVSRLARVGESTLMAIWDIQDLSC